LVFWSFDDGDNQSYRYLTSLRAFFATTANAAISAEENQWRKAMGNTIGARRRPSPAGLAISSGTGRDWVRRRADGGVRPAVYRVIRLAFRLSEAVFRNPHVRIFSKNRGNMRRENWLYVFWLLVGVTIGFWLAQAHTVDPIKGFWEIVSAVGTWAAVVVALVFSVAGYLTAQRHASEKTGLVAAEVVATLEAALRHIDHIEGHLVFYEDSTDGTDNFLVGNPFLTSRPLSITAEVLVGLIHLPNRCAHRTAFGLSRINILHAEIASALASKSWGSWKPASRISLVSEWWDRLGDARDYIRLAQEDCVRAAELAAPAPTAQERYGDDFDLGD
jgi:hypothetical protein